MRYLIIFIYIFTLTSYSYSQSNYIFVDVKIKGKKMKFLFDNRVDYTAITRSKLDYISKKKVPKFTIQGIDATGKTITISVTKKKYNIHMDKIHSRINLLILDKVPEFFKEKGVDGILGNDVISELDWTLDFEQHRAKMYKDEEFTANDFLKIDKFKNDSINLKISLEDKQDIISVPFEIDLGYSGKLICNLDSLQYKNPNLYSIGLTSSLARKNTIMESTIEIGNLEFREFKIMNVPIENSKEIQKNLLGVSFLSKFDKVILYNSKNQLWLMYKPFVFFSEEAVSLNENGEIRFLTAKEKKNLDQNQLGSKLPNYWKSKTFNWKSTIKKLN